MVEATIKSKYLAGAKGGLYFITYELSNIGTSSSEIFSLPLFSKNLTNAYLHPHQSNLEGEAYGVELLQYVIDCESTDFDLKILNFGDVSKEDSVNQVYQSLNVNSYEAANDVNVLFLNQDDPQTNNLYALINNNDGSNATGTIEIQLAYTIIRNKS